MRPHEETLSFLLRTSAVLAENDDERSALQALATAAVPAFAAACVVHLVQGSEAVETVARTGAGLDEVRAANRPARLSEAVRAAIETRRVQVHGETGSAPTIAAPMLAQDSVLGAIEFAAPSAGWCEEAPAVAADVAGRAALAIENRRARSQAAASRQSRDLFLAMLSHEIKTPLTSILGWTRILRTDGRESSLFDEALSAIEQSANVQQRLIEDLLDVSRIMTGKLHLERAAIGIQRVVEAVVEMLEPRARENAQHIRVHATAPLLVHGDETRLRQVVWNLLTNSMKFTPSGGLIEVGVEAADDMVALTVQDTGRGIRSDVLPHVFDRFHQAAIADRAKHGGLGLGLAIVRNIVELHGGRVEARSDGEGRGATFVVRLPLHRALTETKGEAS